MSRFLIRLSLLVLFSVPFGTDADWAVLGPYSDHMVLQQGAPTPVWGTAEPGTEVTVSFAGRTWSGEAEADGTWQLMVGPFEMSNQGQPFRIQGEEDVVFQDVLVGEVWICSGQSNMEWPVARAAQPQKEIQAADWPQIRHVKIPKEPANVRRENIRASWQVCSPETVGGFTAVGYSFARALHRDLGVPVGLINTTWGGTRIEAWIPREGYESVQEHPKASELLQKVENLDTPPPHLQDRIQREVAELKIWLSSAEQAVSENRYPQAIPDLKTLIPPYRQDVSRLYRGMVHPLAPVAVQGVIWYQGEANAGQAGLYTMWKEALVHGWRTVWAREDLPFYWVQLAAFRGDQKSPAGGDGFAPLREAQRRALHIPHTGMAVAIDVGNSSDIHPKNKQDVGQRLARWALHDVYDHDLIPSGPLYRTHSVEDDVIRLSFDYVGDGLMVGKKSGLDPVTETPDEPLQRFALSGPDGNWVWADARIDGDTVVVSSPEVDSPVAVRYAYSANPVGANLYNRNGLPASPFQTDKGENMP